MACDWTVTDGSAEIPEEILAAAAASQATLGDKLAALRSLSEPFPETVGPAAGDRWISDPGPPRAWTASGAVEESCPSPESEPARAGGDLADLSAAALLAGYRTGAFGPVEVVNACLARIDGTNMGAVVTLDSTAREQAAQSAVRWREGDAGPLEGVPVGVKDIINTRGLRTTAGSTLFADHAPASDATVVARLRGRRCGDPGQDHHPGVRLRRRDRRRREESSSAGPVGRGQLLGFGRGAGSRLLPGGPRHRHRRIDPGTVVVLRRERAEADVRAGAPRGASSECPGPLTMWAPWHGPSRI